MQPEPKQTNECPYDPCADPGKVLKCSVGDVSSGTFREAEQRKDWDFTFEGVCQSGRGAKSDVKP